MVPCTALRKPEKRGKVRRQTYDEILSKSEERSIDLRHEQPNVTNYGCKPSLFSSVFALWYAPLSFCSCTLPPCSQLLFFSLFFKNPPKTGWKIALHSRSKCRRKNTSAHYITNSWLVNTKDNDSAKCYCCCSPYVSALFTMFDIFKSRPHVFRACQPSGRSLFQISYSVI